MQSNSETIEMTPLAELIGEFPRIDDRFAGRRNRWGWQLVQDGGKPLDLPGGRSGSGMMMNTLGRIDLETGESETYWIGSTSSFQEPAFIPRPGSSDEGDGYIVILENRLAELASRLLLFDAMRLEQGPIATIGLPFRIRQGLHGNWVPSAAVA
jgi:carotenoid cleavage dioxygenase